jgi:hypothetical protein
MSRKDAIGNRTAASPNQGDTAQAPEEHRPATATTIAAVPRLLGVAERQVNILVGGSTSEWACAGSISPTAAHGPPSGGPAPSGGARRVGGARGMG